MATQTSRRAFLRGDFNETDTMRPFGASYARAFEEACDGCGKCLSACPESIIVKDDRGLPLVDFNEGACTFCGECIDACPTGALSQDYTKNWTWKAHVRDGCLSLRGIACRACEDSCDERALRFRLQIRGRATPEIDENACTGCGACVAGCPTGAIELTRQIETKLEAAE